MSTLSREPVNERLTLSIRLETGVTEMQAVLSGRWPRRKLGFITPDQAWERRPQQLKDRSTLLSEVRSLSVRLLDGKSIEAMSQDLADRLAVEIALSRRGYLKIETGGRCQVFSARKNAHQLWRGTILEEKRRDKEK